MHLLSTGLKRYLHARNIITNISFTNWSVKLIMSIVLFIRNDIRTMSTDVRTDEAPTSPIACHVNSCSRTAFPRFTVRFKSIRHAFNTQTGRYQVPVLRLTKFNVRRTSSLWFIENSVYVGTHAFA